MKASVDTYNEIMVGNLRHLLTAGQLHDRLVYGAPSFAPLHFTNLAALAGLGIWGVHQQTPLDDG